jgi:hypothetical protein
MTIRLKQAAGLVLFAASAVASSAFAHTTIVKKNTPDEFAMRTDLAGTSSVLNQISIPHGCNGKPVKAMTILFPNGADPVVEDNNGDPVDPVDFFAHFETDNNILMGPQPAQVVTWKKIEVREGPVPHHDNHGPKDTDARAFAYTKGTLPEHLLGLYPWRQTYGKIKEGKTCLEKIQLRIPIVNYCTRLRSGDDRVDAWIGRLTAKFNDAAVVSVGFWPTLDIANPHYDQDDCGAGNEYYYKVSPSDADIDEFLPLKGYWPDNDGNGLPGFFDFR